MMLVYLLLVLGKRPTCKSAILAGAPRLLDPQGRSAKASLELQSPASVPPTLHNNKHQRAHVCIAYGITRMHFTSDHTEYLNNNDVNKEISTPVNTMTQRRYMMTVCSGKAATAQWRQPLSYRQETIRDKRPSKINPSNLSENAQQ